MSKLARLLILFCRDADEEEQSEEEESPVDEDESPDANAEGDEEEEGDGKKEAVAADGAEKKKPSVSKATDSEGQTTLSSRVATLAFLFRAHADLCALHFALLCLL
jgi:hypothetical protein